MFNSTPFNSHTYNSFLKIVLHVIPSVGVPIILNQMEEAIIAMDNGSVIQL